MHAETVFRNAIKSINASETLHVEFKEGTEFNELELVFNPGSSEESIAAWTVSKEWNAHTVWEYALVTLVEDGLIKMIETAQNYKKLTE